MSSHSWAEEPQGQDGGTAGEVGPDVIVSSLLDTISYPQYLNTLTGYVTGLSLGTQSCNVGDAPISWIRSPSVQHPVIRTSMYRLKNDRFEQIGMSWVKHGFLALNGATLDCSMNCTAPGSDGEHLYPGCSDPYGAYLNGDRTTLGPTLQINAYTGSFSNPVVHPVPSGQNGRLQVHNADLDPVQNANARYYMAAQYIAADDAAAGNGLNNASYQRARVVSAPTVPDGPGQDTCTGNDPQRFCVYLTDSLHDTESPIRAWKNEDPSVVETDAPVPGEGLFTLAVKVTDLPTGLWRYEYALQNLNSDRSGRALTIPVAVGSYVNPESVDFHDVEYHSGEPIDNTDWEASVLPGKIIWTTQTFGNQCQRLSWGAIQLRFDTTAPHEPGETGER
jgi:hypothetical protein